MKVSGHRGRKQKGLGIDVHLTQRVPQGLHRSIGNESIERLAGARYLAVPRIDYSGLPDDLKSLTFRDTMVMPWRSAVAEFRLSGMSGFSRFFRSLATKSPQTSMQDVSIVWFVTRILL